MKSSEFAEFLALCGAVSCPSTAALKGLDALAIILRSQNKTQVAKTLERLGSCNVAAASDAASSWGPTVDYLEPLTPLLRSFAKPALLKDFSALLEFLTNRRSMEIEGFVGFAPASKKKNPNKNTSSPIRNELVQKYYRLLEGALGDDPGFEDVVGEIERPEVLSNAEVVQLAKQFALANSKSRLVALKKIRERHEALMMSRAKSAATGGRVAG